MFVVSVEGREQRRIGNEGSSVFATVACTTRELNEFRIEYEMCHEKAVGLIEEQRPNRYV